MRLHELPAAQRHIDAMLEESGGEITPEIQHALALLDEEIGAKVDWVATVNRERASRVYGLNMEIARLAAMKKGAERSSESLERYLQATLEAMGCEKAEGRLFKATIHKAGKPRIAWTKDVDQLPEGYRRTTVAPDLEAAHEAYENDMLPDGFSVQYTTSLRIR